MSDKKDIRVLSLGGGVQSSYLYLTEEYDCAIFADTQEEPGAVYSHLGWLARQNRARIIFRSIGKLGDHLINGRNSTGGRFVSIPAFTIGEDGKEAILRRQCSKEYKSEVVYKAIREVVLGLKPRRRVPKNVQIILSFGISVEEARRATRIKNRLKQYPWITPRFPLLEQFIGRTDCMRWLRTHVPHETPRSACIFCPYHSDSEWLRIKREDPKGWDRAVEIDRALRQPGTVINRNIDNPLFLHRSLIPIEEVNFEMRIAARLNEIPLFSQECEGMCGV